MKFTFKDVELPGVIDGNSSNLKRYFEENLLPRFLVDEAFIEISIAKFVNNKTGGVWTISGRANVSFKFNVVDFIARAQGLEFNSATDTPCIGSDLLEDYARFYWKSGFLKKSVD